MGLQHDESNASILWRLAEREPQQENHRMSSGSYPSRTDSQIKHSNKQVACLGSHLRMNDQTCSKLVINIERAKVFDRASRQAT
jgi:hypothetical protein